MLIYLTDSLIVDETDPRFKDIIRCAKYLAMAMIEQNHIVRGDFNVLKWLSSIMKGYDEDSVKVFTRLYKRFATYTVPECLHYYVKIILDMPTIDLEHEDEVNIKPLQYTYFLDSTKIQKMPFLGEDTADCTFYAHIGNYYLRKNHINMKLAMRSEKGNGSSIASATTVYVKLHKPVICIVDLDKKYPNQPKDPATTFEKSLVIWKTYPKINEMFYYYVVETQEIENLIPYNYINGLDRWDGQLSKNKESFDKLYNSCNREIILQYFDLKKGLKKCNLMNENHDYLDYAVKCYSCFDGACNENTIIQKSNGEMLCTPLWHSLLKETNEYVADNHDLVPNLLEFQEREWNNIGLFLLDMCCASTEDFV